MPEWQSGKIEDFMERYSEHDMLHLYFAPLRESQHIRTGIRTTSISVVWTNIYTVSGTGTGAGMSVKEMRDVLPENNAGVPGGAADPDEPGRRFPSGIKEISRDGISGDQPESWMSVRDGHSEEKGSGFLLYPDDLDRFFDEVFSDASVRNGEFPNLC